MNSLWKSTRRAWRYLRLQLAIVSLRKSCKAISQCVCVHLWAVGPLSDSIVVEFVRLVLVVFVCSHNMALFTYLIHARSIVWALSRRILMLMPLPTAPMKWSLRRQLQLQHHTQWTRTEMMPSAQRISTYHNFECKYTKKRNKNSLYFIIRIVFYGSQTHRKQEKEKWMKKN